MLNPHQPTLRQTRSAVELMVADERVRENQTLPAFAAAATEAVRTASPTKRAKYAAAADAGAAALAPLQEQAPIWGTPAKRPGVVPAARPAGRRCPPGGAASPCASRARLGDGHRVPRSTPSPRGWETGHRHGWTIKTGSLRAPLALLLNSQPLAAWPTATHRQPLLSQRQIGRAHV